MYGQLAVLAPYLVGDLWKFKEKFLDMVDGYMCLRCKRRFENEPRNGRCWNCYHDEFRTVPIVVGFKNISVLNKIVSTVSLRKTADECLDLPPLRTIDVPYRLAKPAQKLYNSLVQSAQADLLNGRTVSTPAAAHTIMKLLQIVAGFVRSDSPDPENEVPGEIVHFDNGTRMQALSDLTDSIFASADSKVIIWGHFIESMNIIERFLNKQELNYVRVDGSTSNRETLRKKFETDPECRIYLGQVQTGIGIDLIAANYVIYADLPFFSWSHYEQSLKRAHRIGQQRAVTVYRLYAEGSIQEYVLEVLDTKDSLVQSLVNNNLCSLCKFARSCLESGVKPFDEDCAMAKDYVSKPKAKLVTI
jgi:SNF2 family DNA or RNA helicase